MSPNTGAAKLVGKTPRRSVREGARRDQDEAARLTGELQGIDQRQPSAPRESDDDRALDIKTLHRGMDQPRLHVRCHMTRGGARAGAVAGAIERQHTVVCRQLWYDTISSLSPEEENPRALLTKRAESSLQKGLV